MNFPTRGEPVHTYHPADPQRIPRAELAGPWGWCMMCETRDTPAVAHATWRDPETGELVDIVVCAAHRWHPEVVRDACREGENRS